MVGIVIVSHSRELADSIVEFTKMMAPEALIRAAGGMDDGTLGTSYEKIYQAIEDVYSEDGVLVMMDMGSAVMTTEMVLEEMSDKKIEMIDCPIVEGAVAATVAASAGADFEEVKQNALEAKTVSKFYNPQISKPTLRHPNLFRFISHVRNAYRQPARHP